jgi:hypothetical protein
MAGGGSKPGERRGGRAKGTPNKATQEIKDIAREYGPKAIKRLAEMAGLIKGEGKPAESEQAQVSAMKEILDRAYGKATQMLGGEGKGKITVSWDSD